MSYIIKFPIDGHDSYLSENSGSFTLTTDIKKAMKFKTEKAAGNILKSNLSKTFPYRKYGTVKFVEEKEEAKMIPIKTIAQVDAKEESSYIKIDLEQFQKNFDGLAQQFRDIKGNKEWLNEKLSELDKKIVDIEHYLEFYTFNASDGYKLAKRLKDILIERREIKNQIKIIEILDNSTCAGMMSGIASKKVSQAIKGDFEYTPRILKEMFEGKIKKKPS